AGQRPRREADDVQLRLAGRAQHFGGGGRQVFVGVVVEAPVVVDARKELWGGRQAAAAQLDQPNIEPLPPQIEGERMPLGPSGKVDRKALPAPDGSRPDLQRPYVAPRNEVERKLAEIWAKVLRVDKV